MSEQTRGTEGHVSTEYIHLAVELTFSDREEAAEFASQKNWKLFQDATVSLPWCWDVAASPTWVRDRDNKQYLVAIWVNRLLVARDFQDYILWLLGKYEQLRGIRIFHQLQNSPHIEMYDWHSSVPNKVAYWLCHIPTVGQACYERAKDTTALLHKWQCAEDLYGGSCYTTHKDIPLLRVHAARRVLIEARCKSCERLKGQLTCEHHSQDIEDPKTFFCDDWKPRVSLLADIPYSSSSKQQQESKP